MWIWATIRRAKYAPLTDEQRTAASLSSLLTGGRIADERKPIGYTDHRAIINAETNTIFWELLGTDENNEFGFTITVYVHDRDSTTLAETIDEIAARIGLPEPPRTEIPDVFKN